MRSLESHAHSLAHVLAAKMSVYVMHAPLDNWHTRGNQANAPADPPGCARG